MEFLVEFEVEVPADAPDAEVERHRIETAAPRLEWLNKGIFISVGGRQPGAVIYETYLVG